MFTIYGGKTEFNQWDLDQLVTCPCLKKGDKVVFSGFGKAYETTAFVQDGQVWADVPNFLLKEPGYIRVDLGWGLACHMDCRTTFTVVYVSDDQPNGYVCPYNIKPRNTQASTGGVTSWNELADKPFGEVTEYGDTLTWDGDTTGKTVSSDGFCYKITDYVLTSEDLANGMTVVAGGVTATYDADTLLASYSENEVSLLADELIMVVPESCADTEEPGTYFAYIPGMLYAESMTVPGLSCLASTTVNKLPSKFYDAVKVLYTDGTYIYEDSSLTTKMTKDALGAAIMKTPIVFSLSGAGYKFAFDVDVVTQNYAMVIIGAYNVSSSIASYVVYYTAEYTAS